MFCILICSEFEHTKSGKAAAVSALQEFKLNKLIIQQPFTANAATGFTS